MTLTTYLQTHPAISLVLASIHLLVAEYLNTIQVPTIVMQAFQIGAWTVTMGVGLITIVGFFRKKPK